MSDALTLLERIMPRNPPKAMPVAGERRRGRGAVSNAGGRFERLEREERADDLDDEGLPAFRTEVIPERARTIISRNESPDIAFDRSINPYRGCEHGCAYCFARPTHAYLGLSAGLDFETRIFAKTNAAEVLEREVSAPGYQPRTIAMGANTDPYQPVERELKITRSVLEVLERCNHPVGIVTKSGLVTRDIDLLGAMAGKGLAKVAISVTTLDRKLARALEPRAASPQKRLDTIRALSAAGIPVSVLVAPVIPGINDHEIEQILEAARAAGASEAGYILLRLPLEVRDIFAQWLVVNAPGKARHVLSLVRSTRQGKDYDARFGLRQTGTGPYAWLIGRRFELAAARLGFGKRRIRLETGLFRPPVQPGGQLSLF